MKRLLLFILLISNLVSCSKDHDNLPNFHYELIAVDEMVIPDTVDYEEELDFTLKYTLPNGCYSYNNLIYTKQDSTRVVAIRAFVNDEINCTQATIPEEQTFKLTVSQKEDYIFKLWKSVDVDNKDIFEEKIVRVLEADEQP